MTSRKSHKRSVCTLLYFFAFLLMPSCTTQSRIIKKRVVLAPQKNKIAIDPPQITVWIHGTRLLRRPLYYRYFNGKPGIKHATQLPKQYNLTKIAQVLCSESRDMHAHEHFYSFGWSGKLNSTEREEAAFVLLKELHGLIERFTIVHNKQPHLRIIAHSHGGNLALNLAKVAKKCPEYSVLVNQLILLACPVQNQTCSYISDPIFRHIYALYSTLDIVQIIAPEMSYIVSTKSKKICKKLKIPPLSERRFQPHPKLAQVKIKINGHALWHADFVGTTFLKSLDAIIDEIDHWKKESPPLLCSTKQHLLAIYNYPYKIK